MACICCAPPEKRMAGFLRRSLWRGYMAYRPPVASDWLGRAAIARFSSTSTGGKSHGYPGHQRHALARICKDSLPTMRLAV